MTLSLPVKASPWQAKSLKYFTLPRTASRPSSHPARPQGHAGASPGLPHQGQPGSKSRKQSPARGRRIPARPCLLPGQLASKIFPAGVLSRYFPQERPPWFKLPAEADAKRHTPAFRRSPALQIQRREVRPAGGRLGLEPRRPAFQALPSRTDSAPATPASGIRSSQNPEGRAPEKADAHSKR